MRKRRIVHPFLFPLFPILALYAYNIKSVPVPRVELAQPLAVSLVCAAGLFFVLRAALRDGAKAGLLVSLLFLWLLSFGHIARQVSAWTGGIFNRLLFLATALVFGLVAFFVIRSRSDLSRLTGALNVAAMALVVFNLVSIGWTQSRRPHLTPAGDVRASAPATFRPNIYYIILDSYTRADILEEVFSCDNSMFVSELERRGFSIATRSYANYPYTYSSLASSLNFVYLDELAKEVGRTSSNQEPLFRMIRQNRAMAFLKSQGYRLLAFCPNIYVGAMKDVERPINIEGSISEFRSALISLTPLPLVYPTGKKDSAYDAHRENVLRAFELLGHSPQEQGPFFMFVHIMSPHPPFVFDPDGRPVNPSYPFSLLDGNRLEVSHRTAARPYIPAFRDQLIFLNKKILETVDAILSQSIEPPIIVLQGDHGSRAYADFDHPRVSSFKEGLAILNAYHFPNDARQLVYPGLSPVNTFRLIFKRYFGAELDLLEDRSSWSTWRHPYRFLPFDQGSSVKAIREAAELEAPAVQKR